MIYQDRLGSIFFQLFAYTKFRMFIYNFCLWFWGQHCC